MQEVPDGPEQEKLTGLTTPETVAVRETEEPAVIKSNGFETEMAKL